MVQINVKMCKNCTMCRVGGAMQHYVTRSGDGSPRSQYCNIVTHNQSNPQPVQHPQNPHFCFQMESVSRWPVWPVWVKVSPTDQNCPIRGFPNQKPGLAWLAILQNHQGERSATAILVLVCSSGTPLDVICSQFEENRRKHDIVDKLSARVKLLLLDNFICPQMALLSCSPLGGR